MKKNNMRPVDWVTAIIATVIAVYIMAAYDLGAIVTTFIMIGIWGVLEILVAGISSSSDKKRASAEAAVGIDHVSAQQKEEIQSRQKSSYDYAKESFSESPDKKYSIDYDTINHVINLTKGLIANDIATGQRMQQEKGPQQDWAIVGGLVSGSAGGLAGVAAAADVMRQNAEATEKHHALGRDIEQRAIKNYASLSESQRQINTQKLNGLTYTVAVPSLSTAIKVQCNNVSNYSTGYLDADLTFTVHTEDFFPGTSKKARIDGSVMVELLDKQNKVVASGYYSAPSRSGNDLSKTGFVPPSFNVKVVMKLFDQNFNKLTGYSARISETNLWLLKV